MDHRVKVAIIGFDQIVIQNTQLVFRAAIRVDGQFYAVEIRYGRRQRDIGIDHARRCVDDVFIKGQARRQVVDCNRGVMADIDID